MKLTKPEIEYLSAWAKEEWEPECYQRPAHRLQLAHGISGASLIVFIKAWTANEGKKDAEIVAAAANPEPCWPWSTAEEYSARLEEAGRKGGEKRSGFSSFNQLASEHDARASELLKNET